MDPNAEIQYHEIDMIVAANGDVSYRPTQKVRVTRRLALIVFRIQPEQGVTARFATEPFIWIVDREEGTPRLPPPAVQVTRESDSVATILDLNVSEGRLHCLPVIHVYVENAKGEGSWSYVVPTDPTIINKEDPLPGGSASRRRASGRRR
jgi:hypothetical protein